MREQPYMCHFPNIYGSRAMHLVTGWRKEDRRDVGYLRDCGKQTEYARATLHYDWNIYCFRVAPHFLESSKCGKRKNCDSDKWSGRYKSSLSGQSTMLGSRWKVSMDSNIARERENSKLYYAQIGETRNEQGICQIVIKPETHSDKMLFNVVNTESII